MSVAKTEVITIPALHELRVISEGSELCILKILRPPVSQPPPKDTLEVFGAELPAEREYVIPPGAKLSCYSWGQCSVEISGKLTQAYIGRNVAMGAYASLCALLSSKRTLAKSLDQDSPAPVVLVCGSPSSGKSSVCQLFLNYAVRDGWTPTFVQLDPRGCTDKPGLNFPPGVIGAYLRDDMRTSGVYSLSQFENQDGMSQNQNAASGVGNLVYDLKRRDNPGVAIFYGKRTPEESYPLFRFAWKQLANAIRMQKVKQGPMTAEAFVRRASGAVIDCSAQLDVNEIVDIVHEFEVNTVAVLDDASLRHRLESELNKNATRVSVVSLPKAEGVVPQNSEKKSAFAKQQLRSFFSTSKTTNMLISVPVNCSVGRFEVTAAPPSALPFGTTTTSTDQLLFGQFSSNPNRLIYSVVGLMYPTHTDITKLFVQTIGLIQAVEIISEEPLVYVLTVAVQSSVFASVEPPPYLLLGPSLHDTR